MGRSSPTTARTTGTHAAAGWWTACSGRDEVPRAARGFAPARRRERLGRGTPLRGRELDQVAQLVLAGVEDDELVVLHPRGPGLAEDAVVPLGRGRVAVGARG